MISTLPTIPGLSRIATLIPPDIDVVAWDERVEPIPLDEPTGRDPVTAQRGERKGRRGSQS